MIVDALLEPFETRTEHASQRVNEEDHPVRQVQGIGFRRRSKKVVPERAPEVFELAADRLENVDGVGAAGDGRHALVLAVVLVISLPISSSCCHGPGVE